jgi:hypothetical protein
MLTLELPPDFGEPARNRLAQTVAESELNRLPPLTLVRDIFDVFVDELISIAEAGNRTGAGLQADCSSFLRSLTKAVYWEYPREVRLPDKVTPGGARVLQYSECSWRNLPEFRQSVSEELRSCESWDDLQSAIVEFSAVPSVEKERHPHRVHADDSSQSSDSRPTPTALLAKYRRAFPYVKNAWIYRAAGVHSADFYRWRKGSLPPGAPLSKRLKSFLTAMEAPPERFRRPRPKP